MDQQYSRWRTGIITCLVIFAVIPMAMIVLTKETPPVFSYSINSWRFMTGDDPAWSARGLDDNNWGQATWGSYIGDQTQDYSGPLWVRLKIWVHIDDRSESRKDQFFHLGILGEHQVYWDGELLNRESKTYVARLPGNETLVASVFRIREEKITDGDHVIAIRIEDHQRADPRLIHYAYFEPLPAFSFWGIYYNEEDREKNSKLYFNKENWTFIDALHPTADLPTKNKGIFWMRFQCIIPVGSPLLHNDSNQLVITSLGAYEIFWDGQPIGRSGVPAEDANEEIPGDYLNIYTIPGEHFEPGKHEIAIRASQHFTSEKELLGYVNILTPDQILDLSFWLNSKTMIPMGFALMASLFFGFYYFFGERRFAHFALSAFCLVISLILTIQLFPRISHLPYSRVNDLQILLYILVVLAGTLLLTFHLYLFSIPNKRLWLVLPVVYLSGITSPIGFHVLDRYIYPLGDPTNLAILPVMFLCATTSVLAIRRGIHGSWWALFGICIILSTMLGMKITHAPIWDGSIIYFAFGGHMFCLILSTITEGQEWRRNYQRSLVAQVQLELNKTRLESELNKKNIQPHFIMNTLTSLMEWVEKNPQRSVEFIESLAKEFRLASELSSQTVIPLFREIEVCRSHLKLMSFQQNLDFHLQEQVSPEHLHDTFMIPPYTLQTLTENGITHNLYHDITDPVIFSLSITETPESTDLVFETPYLPEEDSPSSESPATAIEDGAGLTYVKSRLRESFGDNWTLTQGVQENRWRTHIKLRLS